MQYTVVSLFVKPRNNYNFTGSHKRSSEESRFGKCPELQVGGQCRRDHLRDVFHSSLQSRRARQPLVSCCTILLPFLKESHLLTGISQQDQNQGADPVALFYHTWKFMKFCLQPRIQNYLITTKKAKISSTICDYFFVVMSLHLRILRKQNHPLCYLLRMTVLTWPNILSNPCHTFYVDC